MLCCFSGSKDQGGSWPAGGSAKAGSELGVEAQSPLKLAAMASRWPGGSRWQCSMRP